MSYKVLTKTYLKNFHTQAGLPVNKALTGHAFKDRMMPLLEEAGETKEALHTLGGLLRSVATTGEIHEASLHALKEMMDLRYTIESLCLAFGWDSDEAYLGVCRSNDTKVAGGAVIVGGKVQKGPNYVKPDLSSCIPCPQEDERNRMMFEAPLDPLDLEPETIRSLIKTELVKDIGAMGPTRFRGLLDRLVAAVGEAK